LVLAVVEAAGLLVPLQRLAAVLAVLQAVSQH
jgi:hypothetical protein